MRKALTFAFSILFLLIHIETFAQTENKSPAKNPVSFVATGLLTGDNQIIENKNDAFYLIVNDNSTGLLIANDYVTKIDWLMPDKTSIQLTDRLGYTYDGSFIDNYLVLSYDEKTYLFEQYESLPILHLAPEQWADGLEPFFFIEDKNIKNQISAEKIAEINEKAAAISEKYGIEVYIIIVSDFQNYACTYDIELFSEEIVNGYRLGNKNEGNALVLVMSMNERDYDIFASGIQSEEIFSNYTKSLLEDAMLPHFKENNWADGFLAFLDECEYIQEQAQNGEIYSDEIYSSNLHNGRATVNDSQRTKMQIVISLVIGLLIGLIARACVKASYINQVKQKSAASEYLVENSFNLTGKSDIFTHTTTSSTYSPRSSSSSSHSSGRGRSGSHSSGKF